MCDLCDILSEFLQSPNWRVISYLNFQLSQFKIKYIWGWPQVSPVGRWGRDAVVTAWKLTCSTPTSFGMERIRTGWNILRESLSDSLITSFWGNRKIKMKICGRINCPDKGSLLSQSTISYHQEEPPPHSKETALKRISYLQAFRKEPTSSSPAFMVITRNINRTRWNVSYGVLSFHMVSRVLTVVKTICLLVGEPTSGGTATVSVWPLVMRPEPGKEKGVHWLKGEVHALSRVRRDPPVCFGCSENSTTSLQLCSSILDNFGWWISEVINGHLKMPQKILNSYYSPGFT